MLCYDQNLWKLKYLSGISIDLHRQFFFSFSTFLNCFTLKWLKMTQNGEFCQKSGLDWLQMANYGHFACFSIFTPKMRLRLTQNSQFHPIHNFSHLLPPKCLIFGEISKIFIQGGSTSAIFLSFSTFFKSFHTEAAQNDPQWQILPKSGLDWLQMANFGHFECFFHFFPQNEAQIDSEWPISPDSQLFPSFATKVSHFWRNLKNFHSCGGWGGYIGKFFEFFNFFELFHTKPSQNDPQWPIWPLKWPRLAQNGQFWLNFNKNLNISVES